MRGHDLTNRVARLFKLIAAIPTNAYVPGGTDVALADGGTGASLVDPNADRILFWDDSAGTMTWLDLGTNLSITGTTLNGAAAGMTLLETLTTTSGASVTTTASLSSYRRLYIELIGVSTSGNVNLQMQTSTDGTNFGTALTISAVSSANNNYATICIDALQLPIQGRWITGSFAISTTATPTAIGVANAANAAGAITHVRFLPASGTFDAGSIRIYGE